MTLQLPHGFYLLLGKTHLQRSPLGPERLGGSCVYRVRHHRG